MAVSKSVSAVSKSAPFVRPDAPERGDVVVLVIAAILYLPLAFLGYGADIDSYVLIETGEEIIDSGRYVPSRTPGFPVHETAVALLDYVGGSVATNLASVAFALLTLAAFLALCRRFGVPHRWLLGLTLAFHPFVWVNAGSTMDYLWALGFGLAGGVALLDRRWIGAGLLFALAIGTRLTSVLFIAPLFGYVIWRDVLRSERPDRRGVVGAGLLTAMLGAACYLPVVIHFGWTDFLTPMGAEVQATWTPIERIGRFVYKSVYLWGLPAALGLAVLIVRAAVKRDVRFTPLLTVAVTVVLLYGVFFLRYPLEQEYLLPVVPFMLLGLGVLAGRRWLVALFVLVLAYNAVSINLARPDRPNLATRAEIGVWVEPGYLVTDIAQRLRVYDCRSMPCWLERSDRGFFPDLFGAEADE